MSSYQSKYTGGQVEHVLDNAILKVALTLSDEELELVKANLKYVTGDDVSDAIEDAINSIPTPDVSGQINSHNEDTSAHPYIQSKIEDVRNDIPTNISDLTNDKGFVTEKEVTDLIDSSISNIPTPDVSGLIDTHNNDQSAHPYIQSLIDAVKNGIPTNLSELTNDADFITESSVIDLISDAIDSIPIPDVSDQIDGKIDELKTSKASCIGIKNMVAYLFASKEDKEKWSETGEELWLDSEAINLVDKTIRIISEKGNSLGFAESQDKAIVSVSWQSLMKSVTSTEYQEVIEDAVFSISIDSGSTGTWTKLSNITVQYGQDFSIDIKPYLVIGDNRILIEATGAQSLAQGQLYMSVYYTSMYLQPFNFEWNNVFTEGSKYLLGGMKIGGGINKILNVKVTNDENGYSAIHTLNLGTSTSINQPFYFYDMVFPNTGTGVYHVEIWLDANGLESDHLHYNIMCIASADINTAQLICINDISKNAMNGSDSKLVGYSLYNGVYTSASHSYTVSVNDLVVVSDTLYDVPTKTQQSLVVPLDVQSNDLLFDVLVTLSLGEFTTQATVTIDNSLSFPSVKGAIFYMNAASRNNSQINKEFIVNEVDGTEYSIESNNIAYEDGIDGHTVDEEGNKCLVIPATCSMKINHRPMLQIGNGWTFELLYKVRNAVDYDENIITIADNPNSSTFRGIKITPKNVCIHSRDLNSDDLAQSYNTKDEELVHLTITLIKKYKNYGNLAQIYVNGVKKTSFSFTDSDDFTNSANLLLGSQTADLYIYKMRIYDQGFEWNSVMLNFINCLPSQEDKLKIHETLTILDNNVPNYDSLTKAGYNTMVIEMLDGAQLPDKLNQSGGKCNVTFNFPDSIADEMDDDFKMFFSGNTIYGEKIDGQGTTAQEYYRWNFRWKLSENYNKRRITAKKNVASSMHSHKMGATRMFNDLHEKICGKNETGKRVAVYQYPAFGFLKTLKEGTKDEYFYTYIGLYTVGPDKGDKTVFGYDDKAYKKTLIHLEGSDHTPMMVGYDYPWEATRFIEGNGDDVDAALGAIVSQSDIAKGWEVGAAGPYDIEDPADTQNVQNYFDTEFRPAYDSIYRNSTSILGVDYTVDQINQNTIEWRSQVTTSGKPYSELEFYTNGIYDLYYFDLFENKYVTSGINVLTDVGLTLDDVRDKDSESILELIKSKRRERFKTEFVKYWDLDDALFHDVFCEIIGATDNFKKNNYPYKFALLSNGGKWKKRQDDLDTIFDINNKGFADKKYSILLGDKTSSGSVYRGDNSNLTILLQECFSIEKVNMARKILDAMKDLSPYGKFSIDKLVGYVQSCCWDNAQEYFTKGGYNSDAEWTYEDAWPLLGNQISTNPLSQSQGDHYEAERDWIEQRMTFVASYYNWGPFAKDNGSDQSTGQLSFRTAKGHTFDIKPALDHNPTLLIGDSEVVSVGGRTFAGETVELTLPDRGNNDTSMYLLGLDYFSEIGDLNTLKISTQEQGLGIASKRLTKLKVGDELADKVTSDIRGLSITECPSMEEIDAQNLSTLTDVVDLSGCPRLKRAYFNGTNVKNIIIPEGSKIEELRLPKSLTTVSLVKLLNLTEENLHFDSLESVELIRLEDNTNLDGWEMLKSAYVNSPKLQYIRIVGFNHVGDSTDIDMIANFATGVDENGIKKYHGINESGTGDKSILPVLDGVLTINTPVYENSLNIVSQYYPHITIDAPYMYLNFEDQNVLNVLLANGVGDGNGVTEAQAAAVTSIGTWFKGNTSIESFDELGKFTNVTKLENQAFKGCSNLNKLDLTNIMTLNYQCCYGVGNIEVFNTNATDFGGTGVFANSGITKAAFLSLTTILNGSYGNNENYGVFYGCKQLTSFSAENINSIGTYAFSGCSLLNNIGKTDYVTSIGIKAFFECLALKQASFPRLTQLGPGVFARSGIEYLNLGTVETIIGGSYGNNSDYGACYGATELKMVEWSSIKSIGRYAFGECSNLTTIGNLESAEIVESNAFYNCTSLTIEDLSLPNLETLGWSAFNGVKIKKISNLGKITSIPQHTNDSCPGTFGDPNWLEELILPDTLVSIGSRGLMKYTALKYLNIPSSVTSIGTNACHSCSSLEYIVVKKDTPPSFGSGALINTNNCPIYVPDASVNDYKAASGWINYADRIYPMSLYELGGIDNVISFEDPAVEEIIVAKCDTDNNGLITKNEAEAVTSIGTWFKGNTAIETFDEFERFTGVVQIGPTNYNSQYAFQGCTSLTSIKLPNGIKILGTSSFEGCSALRQINLPESITTICGECFRGSSINNEISLPNLQELRQGAFAKTNITKVIDIGNVTSFGEGSYDTSFEGGYRNTFSMCKSLTKVVLPNVFTTIGRGAFGGCSALVDINFPKSVTKINYAAFYNCTSLEIEDLSLPNLETLEQNAFYGVKIKKISNLEKITTLPVAKSDSQNFGNKSVLEEVTLPESLQVIPGNSFYGYANLSNVVFSPNITSIDASAFSKCSSLEMVINLPKLKSLGNYAFCSSKIKRVENLGEITILPASNTSEKGIFGVELEEIVLPDTLKEIKESSLHSCSKLIKINFPASLESIERYALSGCSSLTIDELSLPNLILLGTDAFNRVKIKKISDLGNITALPGASSSTQNFGDKSVLEEVVLPETLTSIPNGSFYQYTNCVIEDLNLPNLTTLGGGAFNSTKLRRITSLGSVTRLEADSASTGPTFLNCTELTHIEQSVLDKLTFIATAFSGCSNLEIEELKLPSLEGTITAGFSRCNKIKRVTDLGDITAYFGDTALNWDTFPFGENVELIIIPENVQSIGSYGFANQNNTLKTIIVNRTTPPQCALYWASNMPSDTIFYVPAASVTAYREASGWIDYADRITGMGDFILIPIGKNTSIETITLTACYKGKIVTPEYSVDSDIATVVDGVLIFNDYGTVTVTATYNGVNVSASYTYTDTLFEPIEIVTNHYVNQQGQLIAANGVIACKNIPVKGHYNITWGTKLGTLDRLCTYDADYNFINYYEGNKQTESSIRLSSRAEVIVFNVTASSIQSAYIKDTDTGEYLWKGNDIE